jgi:hypothetical protein
MKLLWLLPLGLIVAINLRLIVPLLAAFVASHVPERLGGHPPAVDPVKRAV